MAPDLSDVAFRVYILHEDTSDFESLTNMMVETASVLPNTTTMLDDEGNRAILISRGDAQQWPHIVDKIRQLVCQYEKYLDRREAFVNQTEGLSWQDYIGDN